MSKEQQQRRDARSLVITNKIIFHSVEIAILKSIFNNNNKQLSLIKHVLSTRESLINTTIELQLRARMEAHNSALLKLAKEFIHINNLDNIIDPSNILLGTVDMQKGYAELLAKDGQTIYTYNLSYGIITKGEYKPTQFKPYSVLTNTTLILLSLTNKNI